MQLKQSPLLCSEPRTSVRADLPDRARHRQPAGGFTLESKDHLYSTSPAPHTRYYRIGAVHLRFRSKIADICRDYHHLYGHYQVRPAPSDALEVSVQARRSWRTLRTYYHISVDGEERFAVLSPVAVLPHVEWAINTAVMRTLPRFYQIHAGVVSRDGAGLILPGQPQSGKSTLVAGLVQRGFKYLSDEFALIDPDTLKLAPYPKAICIKQGSFEAVQRAGVSFAFDRLFSKGEKGKVRFVDPCRIRPDVVSGPVPVRLIIFPKYVGLQQPKLERISGARAVFELAQTSFAYHRFRGQAINLLADVVEGASCYRLQTGDLDASCEIIEKCLANTAAGVDR